jgi:hypothetical protein
MPRWLRPAPAVTAPISPSADFAAAMGPRNRRRLATGGITLGGVAAISALALWFSGGLPFVHSSSSHSDSSTTAKRVITLIPQQPGLPYGMTKQQVLHRLGRPEKIVGQCWQYPENIKNFVGGTFNAVRLCFYANQYQIWFVQLDGLWRYSEGGTGDVIAPPTSIQTKPLTN